MCWRSFIPTEHVFDADAKQSGDPEGALEGWRVTVLLDRNDGLTRYADGIAQLLLRHGAVSLAQAAHVIGDWKFAGHDLERRSVEDYLEHVLHDLTEHQACKDRVEQQVAIA